MDGVKLNEDPYGEHVIAIVVQKMAVLNPAIFKKWEALGNTLEIDDVTLLSLQHKIRNGTLKTENIFKEVLRKWTAEKCDKANLKVLHDAFRVIGIYQVSDLLGALFYKDMGQLLQIKGHEVTYTLENLVQRAPSDTAYKKIFDILLSDSLISPIRLFRDHIFPPEPPKYYVQRKVIYRPEIDVEFLVSRGTMNHFFLLEGISQDELTKFIGYQNRVDVSSQQLITSTVRHIILEEVVHFNLIANQTREPVHLLQFVNRSFYWIKSTGGFDVVQPYLKDGGINKTEEELKMIWAEAARPNAFCISDSPGMGKTLVLLSLSRSIYENISGDKPFTFFIVLEELAKELNSVIDSKESAINSLALFACHNKLSKVILSEMLRQEIYPLDLYLDGYDEVLQERRQRIDDFIRQIRSLNNIRVYVTTRPHFKTRLQNLLKVGETRLQKLEEQDQMDFLKKFWICQHMATPNPKLEEFAQHCLRQVRSNLTKDDNNIAEIPLQCMLLADVYAQHAVRYSQLNKGGAMKLKVNSMFELYKTIVHLKLKKALDQQRSRRNIGQKIAKRHYINAHTYDSIKLIFPDWAAKLAKHLDGCEEVDCNKMYSVGLLEKSPHSSTPRFVHRTFAEYFVAQFLAGHMYKCNDSFELVFSIIFGQKGVTTKESRVRPGVYEMQNYVIGYFMDRKLDSLKRHNIIARKLLPAFSNMKFDDDDICVATAVSCSQNFVNLFELTGKIFMEHLNICSEHCVKLRDTYFKYLPHLAVEKTSDHNFTKHILGLIQSKFLVGIEYHTYHPMELYKEIPLFQFGYIDNYTYPWIPHCTPLHVAIHQGNYNIVMYLLQEYGALVYNLKYLIHVCVRGSAKNIESLIEDKLLLLQILVDVAKKGQVDWLEEKFEETGCTPILQNQIHFNLLKKLVDLGADINAASQKAGTILHTVSNAKSYLDIIPWAISSGFKLINYCNREGENVLQYAMEKFGALEYGTLACFYKAGANFKNENNKGQTVLAYAVKTGDFNYISEVADYTADVNQVNANLANIAHFTIRHTATTGWTAKLISILEILIAKGFKRIDEQDAHGLTPLQLTIELHVVDEHIIEFFYRNRANFHAVDKEGNSILFSAIKFDTPRRLLDKFVKYGANLFHMNFKDQNAFHMATLYNSHSAYMYLLDQGADSTMRSKKDIDCNLPAHLLFSYNGNVNTELLKGILSYKFELTIENKCGHVPLIQWLKNDIAAISALVQFQNDLEFSPSDASKVLMILIEHSFLEYYISGKSETRTDLYSKFFTFLIKKGAMYINGLENFVEWHNIENDQIKFLKDVKVNRNILTNVSLGKLLRSEASKVPLISLANENIVNAEHILAILLNLRKLSEFVEFCSVLRNREPQNTTHETRASSVEERKVRNTLSTSNSSAIHLAARRGDYNEIKLLLAEYEDQVKKAKYIFHACVRDTADTNDLMLEDLCKIIFILYKVNPDWLDERLNGRTPLLETGVHFRLLSCLVDLGANINARTTNEESVLSLISHGVPYTQIVQWAISNGFKDIDYRDPSTKATPLIHSICQDNVLSVDDLLFYHKAGADFNAVDDQEYSVLFHAIRNQNLEIMEKVLDLGADVNYKTSIGLNAMHIIIGTCSEEVPTEKVAALRLCMSHGFTGVNDAFEDGATPLVAAMCRTAISEELLDFFIETGVPLDEPFLFQAIQFNQNVRIIERLLDMGMNLHYEGADRSNLAHIIFVSELTFQDALNIFKRVVSKGFNVQLINHRNNRNMRPINYVQFQRMTNSYSDENLLELFDYFYTIGLDFNAVDVSDGNSVLLNAIRYNHGAPVISKLINLGADVKHVNFKNQNALHVAAQFCRADAVELLLQKLDYFDATDDFGNTVLHYVFYITGESNRKTLELLLQRGCKLEIKNRDGYTPMVAWIIYTSDYIDTILELQELLYIDSASASCALSALIGQNDLCSFTTSNGSSKFKQLKIGQLITILLVQGGKLLMRDATTFSWDALPPEKLNELNSCNFPNSKYSGFTTSNIKLPIENIIKTLCDDKQFHSLQQIVRIIRPFTFASSVRHVHLLIFTAYLEKFEHLSMKEAKPNFWREFDVKGHINEVFFHEKNAGHLVIQQKDETDADAILSQLELIVSWGFELINGQQRDGLTPLHTMVQVENLNERLLNFFLLNGADFNATNYSGATVLHHAIMWKQNASILRHLINCGSDPRILDSTRRSVLHYATSTGNCSAVKALLDIVDLNSTDAIGDTPLHCLFADDGVDYVDATKLLLQNGASPNTANNYYRIPFLEWIYKGAKHLPSFISMIENNIISVSSDVASKSLTLLISRLELLQYYLSDALIHSLLTFLEIMIEKGGKLLLLDTYAGYTFKWENLSTLMLQAIDNIVDQKIDLELGQEIAIENVLTTLLHGKFYDTFLRICEVVSPLCSNSHGIIITLDDIQNKIKLNSIPNSGLLHQAVSYGSIKQVEELMLGKEENVRSIKYLMHACVLQSTEADNTILSGKIKILQRLSTINRSWLDEDLNGCTPLLQAKVHLKLQQCLVQLGANINVHSNIHGTILHRVSDKVGFTKMLQWLSKQEFNLINQTIPGGLTCLHFAICKFKCVSSEGLELLIESGADINAVDDRGNSVLLYAIYKSESIEFIRHILLHNADPNHTNEDGENVAHLLAELVNKDRCDENIIVEKFDLVASKGFKLINNRNKLGVTPLQLALIKMKDVKEHFLNSLLIHGADFNTLSESGNPVLFYALADGNSTNLIDSLLKYGVNINSVSTNKANAAHKAIMNAIQCDGNVEILINKLQLLVTHGFNKLNDADNFGTTPLHLSMKLKTLDERLIKFFNDNGGEFNATDNEGNSVLFEALKNPNCTNNFIRKLLEYGANLNHKTAKQYNAAHIAIMYADLNKEGGKRIISHFHFFMENGFTCLNDGEETGATALHLALQSTFVDSNLLDLFAKSGANFNSVDKQQFSVLFDAIFFQKSDEVISKCIDYGADVNYINSNKLNAAQIIIMNAVQMGLDSKWVLKHIKLIVSKGFNRLRDLNVGGKTLLQLALKLDYLEEDLLDYFYETGVSFSQVDSKGQCAFFDALGRKSISIGVLQKILCYGADINFETESGITAAHMVIWHAIQGHIDQIKLRCILNLLFSNGFAKVNVKSQKKYTPLQVLMELKDLDAQILQIFYKNGADFNAQGLDDHTIISWAILYDQSATIIAKLIEYGSDPLKCTSQSCNAMHVAALSPNYAALEYLVDKFVDVDSVNDDGDTPLHVVFLREGKDYYDVLELLLRKGTKLNIQNKEGITPLVRWIKEGKNPLPTLVALSHLLPITQHIATEALTTIVDDESFLERYMSNESLVEAFKIFFSFLVCKGAKLLKKDASSICWNDICESHFEILNQFVSIHVFQDIFTNPYLTSEPEINQEILCFDLSYIIKTNIISIEHLLECMLNSKSCEMFVPFCSSLNFLIR